jgi:signal peptidase I
MPAPGPPKEVDSSDANSAGVSLRHPWVAAALSFLMEGLGHLYAGRPRRGIAVWIVARVGGVLVLAVAMRLPPRLQLPVLGLAVVIIILVAWDAIQVARRQDRTYQLRPYNRWYVYVGLLALSAFVLHPMLVTPIRQTVGTAYRLPSTSMEPTLLRGDYLLTVPLRGAVRRGQLVVYRVAQHSFMKRVVGLPGDTLAMRDGQLIVNGHALSEPYAVRADHDPLDPEFSWQQAYVPGSDTTVYRPSLRSWGPLVLPPQRYFILGDNRGESYDSRYTGFVARSALVGRPTVVYFSRDPATGIVRWRRIGKPADGARS